MKFENYFLKKYCFRKLHVKSTTGRKSLKKVKMVWADSRVAGLVKANGLNRSASF